MAKATKTIRQALHYPPQYAAYFAAKPGAPMGHGG